jgi:thioesterase domain-containing protein
VLAPLLTRGPTAHLPLAAAARAMRGTDATRDSGDARSRLAALPPGERRAALLGLVRDEVAAVLGYDSVPDRPFTELGFDSFTGVLLRNRLSVLTGLRLPGTLAFDQPGVPELTDHLLAGLDGTLPAREPSPRPVLRLAELYQQVCAKGETTAATYLLATASLALPSFGAESSQAHAVAPERLAVGPAEAALVCFPDFFPQVGGISVFARLAAQFEGKRDVFEIPYPRDAVPEDFQTLAHMHAQTVRDHLGDRPVVLIGYSAGGCTAQAVASRLTAAQSPPAAVILIDTYRLTGDDPDWLLSLPAAAVSRAGTRFAQVVDDTAVAAMGAYLRLVVGWQPAPTGAPVLFLRAQAPMTQMPAGEEWRASWPLADHTADIPGNHLELLDEHAPATAAAISSWLGLDGRPRPGTDP